MPLMTAAEKAAKRSQISASRSANSAIALYEPIVYKQTRSVASQSGAPYDVLLGVAYEALALAMLKGDPDRPGFFRYVKMYVRGYLCNYLRDSSRPVRLPRVLTAAYLSEQRALRTDPSFRALTDEQRAAALSIDLDILLESRTAIAIDVKDLDLHDKAEADAACGAKLQAASDLVAEVIDAGCKAVARMSKTDETQLKNEFYLALRQVLEARANDSN